MHEHWTSIDLIPESSPHFSKFKNQKSQDLVSEDSQLPNNIWQIYSSHFFEHLNLHQVRQLLKKCFDHSATGSTLRIVVPDADIILDRYAHGDINFFNPLLPILASDKLEPTLENHALVILNQANSQNPKALELLLSFKKGQIDSSEIIHELNKLSETTSNDSEGRNHLTCFNYDYLEGLLKEAGYKHIEKSFFMGSRTEEMRETPLFDSTHPWMSLYVEASKH